MTWTDLEFDLNEICTGQITFKMFFDANVTDKIFVHFIDGSFNVFFYRECDSTEICTELFYKKKIIKNLYKK